ncbi:aminoglycoside phosphotransferase family protein [Lamprobacter modestohalophilus]|uniref:phosphotransferase enzyme family protein n=1 Tax=Lamprobacter modestohalophilus TaxID=1064514 RepID=UPI002ADEE41C|nr:aminoglycoside phosphotransferase family protein [Lamprobacter modestohalophilus]MEA1051103.1 aminoglycoside phosphotransferase family protein [Lamprobacter modestohalophilus]
MDDWSGDCCQGEDAVAEDMARRFLVGESRLRLSPLGAGLINETRLVETAAQRFVLQRINGAIFANADAIAENLLQVQDWLCTHEHIDVRLPRLIPAASGEATLRDADGQAWRLLEYVDNSRVIKPLENLEQAAEVGRALGRFHAALAKLDPSRLALTLPELHDTPRYKATLDAVVRSAMVANLTESTETERTAGIGCQADAGARVRHPTRDGDAGQQAHQQTRLGDCSLRLIDAEVTAALWQIEARAALIPRLQQAQADGVLASYVTHGDPKLDNVLFARDEDRALCLIDLDTVQPGLLHQDIADCLRSCCNRSVTARRNGSGIPSPSVDAAGHRFSTGSSSSSSSSTGSSPRGMTQRMSHGALGEASTRFDLSICRALLSGYAEFAAPLFDRAAVALLYPAIRLIPLELAIRFLTDYLEGDRYFRVTSPRQNLDKTLIQLALVEDIETKHAAIEEIIRDCFACA